MVKRKLPLNRPVAAISFCWMLLIFFTVALQAQRQPELICQQSVGGCVNPLGLLVESRLHYRKPLSQDTSILFRSTKLEVGIVNEWSPGDEMFGVAFNIEPIAIFNVLVKAGVYENYRLFGYGYQQLAGKDGPYHDTIRATIKQENHFGSRISVVPSLKMKLASLIIADNLNVNRIDFFTIDADEYFYEIRTALPHAAHDVNFINDVYLLYEWNKKITTGCNYNLVYIRGTNVRQQKLGGMLIYQASPKRVTSLFGVVIGGIYLESDLRNHSFYAAALGGVEFPLSRRKKEMQRSVATSLLLK